MGVVGAQPAPAIVQLAALFVLTQCLVLFAAMSIVDGLIFRRVRFRLGLVILGTVRGVLAQLIGVLCIAAELAGTVFVIA